MITFECPHCEQTYNLPPENAGKKTKCRNCGKPAVVPDPTWVALADDEDGGEEVAPTPRPERGRVRAERARRPTPAHEPEPEPAAYGYAERVARVLSVVNHTVGFLGVVALLAGAAVAVVHADSPRVGVGLLAAAAGCFVSVFATEATCQTVMVIVDLARTARAMRDELAARRDGPAGRSVG